MNLFTVGRKCYFGMCLRYCRDAAGNPCLHGVIWYPRGRFRLGYLYPSITF